MVEIFKVTGKRIVLLGLLVTLIGMILCGYHKIFIDLIFHGKLPQVEDTRIAIGSVLMMVGPWIIKARSVVKRSVQ